MVERGAFEPIDAPRVALGPALGAAQRRRAPARSAACRASRRRARSSRRTRSRSTLGANGRNDSRNLILRFICRLHRRRARVAEDAARAERARAELHAPLEPADDVAGGEQSRGGARAIRRIGAKTGGRARPRPEERLDLVVAERGAEVGGRHRVACRRDRAAVACRRTTRAAPRRPRRRRRPPPAAPRRARTAPRARGARWRRS